MLSLNSEKRYLYVARRWLWLLILAPILASAIGYAAFKDQSTQYEAESQLLIGPGMDTPFQDINSLRASEHVMQTYKKMAFTDTFLQAVAKDINMDEMSPGEIRPMIDIQPDPASLLLTINVQASKPDLAVSIANAVARELVRMSPTNEGSSAATLRDDNQVQAAKLADSIKQTEARLAGLDATMANLNSENAASGPAQSGDPLKAQAEVNGQEARFVALTSAADQSQNGLQILQTLISNTLDRIDKLETRLANTDSNLQPIVLDQIASERSHLSDLQKSVVELQAQVENQSLGQYILTLNQNIQAIQDKINITPSYDINNRKLLFDRLDQERGRLTDAEKIAASRRQMVLDRISDERKRLSDLQGLPAQERQYVSDQITSERNHMDNMQQSYAALNDAIFKASTNQAQIAQLATDGTPVPSNLRLVVLMAAIAGLAAAAAFVLIYGYFDNGIYTTADLEALIGFPTLGHLRKSAATKHSADRLVAHAKPASPLAEDYRKIVARLAHEMPAEPGQGTNLLVTSLSEPDVAGETAANLAITLAETGKTVLLVDANLHQPVIANLFELSQEKGLTSSLANPRLPIEARPAAWLNNLSILPSGPVPQQPFGMLASEPAEQLFNRLKEQAAYVLIAGAPTTNADLLVLAQRVDGVILVVPDKNVQRAKVEEFVHVAQANQWNVIGAILLDARGKGASKVKAASAPAKLPAHPLNGNGKVAKDAEIVPLTSGKR